MSITRALFLGWGDLLRPRILTLVLTGMALTIGLFIVLQSAVFWLIRQFTPGDFSLPWIGTIDVGNTLSWGSLALFPVMGFFLMAPVAAAFCGIFTERVSKAVETIHYPNAEGQPMDFMDGLLESFALVGAMIAVAIISLILTPFLGPFAPVLFYGANGWLLGREFFQMVARRHLTGPQAKDMRKSYGGRVMVLGAMIAVALTVPIVNIAVPLLASAAFTHLFHIIRGNTDRNVPARRG